ncbi:MAG: hypothetical protein KGI40_06715 [Xanthomonadaceae bacterium]|nr:hypothetical protein [Xanthomonadaceae bacterium]MDE2178521.1 hypothetical protein [Xanthomonadaceae bacterium]MDE2244764.1 hypothetical protein [Xanthomonadaceae bacterium]
MNLHRAALTAAVLAGLGFATAASAVSITYTGTLPEGVANFDIAGNSTAIGITPQIAISIDPSDNIIGRTTGFALRITLSGSATFSTTPTFTAGPSLPSGWTATLGAGGSGSNYVVVSFNPPSSSPVPGITNGILVYVNSGNTELNATSGHALKNLAALQTLGQTVSENYQFYDPVSATAILNPVTQPVLFSGQPFQAYCGAPFYPQERIDVGQNSQHPSRTYFALYGNIGELDYNEFWPGYFVYYPLPAFGYFTTQPSDTVTTVIQGSFAAFNQPNAFAGLYFTKYYTSSTTTSAFTNNNQTLTVHYQPFPSSYYNFNASNFYDYVYFYVPTNNLIPIQATPLTMTTSYTRNGVTDTLPNCPLQPLQYNGPVVHVYTFNPAGNTTQQSFLRISNTGPAGGQVTITGIDDAGNPGVGPVSFNLGAGQSIQLTSSDLQNGNTAKGLSGALGTPTGKWRLTVTSYFPNLVVTSLNRNNSSGTVSNLTDYDTNGKQSVLESGNLPPPPPPPGGPS